MYILKIILQITKKFYKKFLNINFFIKKIPFDFLKITIWKSIWDAASAVYLKLPQKI